MAATLESAQKMVEQPMHKLENISSSTYFAGMAGSIIASLVLFLFGKRQWSLFVGLWAPTILNMGLFNKMLRPSQDIAKNITR